MLEKINQLMEGLKELHAQNAEELEALRIKYLGRKGALNDLMAEFRNVPGEQKREMGIRLNQLKNALQERFNELKQAVVSDDGNQDDLDLTRTPYPVSLGTRHPLTIVQNQILDIFGRLGFSIAEGPEVEDDLHVFTRLNFAADH
ncbi:MAG: phenylalanine--tRNA ligase subunit alpha, partial [Bacteroidaceae bacterium]|nr:phenylalanine--tRNA ligase subunit alpha [Bacteroidaceae bacterium]